MKTDIIKRRPVADVLSRRRSILERRKRLADRVVKKLAGILSGKYSAKRVVLVGSCAHPERFGFHSDIDLAVQGIPDARFFSAAGDLMLASGVFNVDLIPIEDAEGRMLETISRGKVLYEER